MASASAQIERRRASRLLIRIPVSLVSNDNGGQRIYASAEAVTISRFGALLRTPIEPDSGSVLEILNSLNEEVKEFRVIWAVRAPQKGLFEVGVEMFHPVASFWGVPFPNDSSQAGA